MSETSSEVEFSLVPDHHDIPDGNPVMTVWAQSLCMRKVYWASKKKLISGAEVKNFDLFSNVSIGKSVLVGRILAERPWVPIWDVMMVGYETRWSSDTHMTRQTREIIIRWRFIETPNSGTNCSPGFACPSRRTAAAAAADTPRNIGLLEMRGSGWTWTLGWTILTPTPLHYLQIVCAGGGKSPVKAGGLRVRRRIERGRFRDEVSRLGISTGRPSNGDTGKSSRNRVSVGSKEQRLHWLGQRCGAVGRRSSRTISGRGERVRRDGTFVSSKNRGLLGLEHLLRRR
ncbi:hypothetical protein B0H19DRAFT_1351699 [Mycena capillaripes]|nr:hypothetical protein B0H19DRAFT_1351699 [Mycena capillaripes]